MKLKYVTCSGVNEHTSIDDLFELYAEFPMIEFGIQVSGQKCGYTSPRLSWLNELYDEIMRRRIALPLALHLNQDWVTGFCDGRIPSVLYDLLLYRNHLQMPMFNRVQLNFKIGRERKPDFMNFENMILLYRKHRFIFSYNEANANFIKNFYARNGAIFDCLYDESFGEGIVPNARKAPAFKDVLQGYAGGLSAENVQEELSKIAEVLPENAQFYIDAEGKLKDASGYVSVDKCREFIAAAMQWQSNY